MNTTSYIRWFETLGREDVALVGGKNASLGEMISTLRPKGITVPDGFATTADAFWTFLEANHLKARIHGVLDAMAQGSVALSDAGASIRTMIREADMPPAVADAIQAAYEALSQRYGGDAVDVAVRSSATAEDLPEASFAGQQESYLNVRGAADVIDACRMCFASLFTDRALAYREAKGFRHHEIALSVGVQQMVHANKAGAGVMFTLDPETGFPDVVVINAAWGLGENVVKGVVTPDQYTVFKPLLQEAGLTPIIRKTWGSKAKKLIYTSNGTRTANVVTTESERTAFVLSDAEIIQLAQWGEQIEAHYGMPMDIEWAKDGDDGMLYIVQARPETVQARRDAGVLKTYRLTEKGGRLVSGQSIGEAVATGRVCIIRDVQDIDRFEPGAILVTEITDPDWVPVMKQAAGIVTDQGGRTSHAAIVSRELGIPALVGTGTATHVLVDGQAVTLSCAEGDEGYVYDGTLSFTVEETDLSDLPETETAVMINLGSPAAAMRWWMLPCKGVGLARIEYLISHAIKVHPMALARFDEIEDEQVRTRIEQYTRGYEDRTEYFIDRLAQGIATVAASRYPDPVIVRTSDFKTNEYANLIGGQGFEPQEANPMLGWRGAARYYSEDYRDGFALECAALKRVREGMGFTNVIVMIPFCRTIEEADRVLEEMGRHGLRRGEKGLQVYVMAEIPSNVVLADQFAERFDGFSIGSNDLTQLALGVDRDSTRLAYLFDERNEAVLRMIESLIETAHRAGRPVGICGQGPSDYPEFAEFLVTRGIDSISVLPDSLVDTLQHVAATEAALQPHRGSDQRTKPDSKHASRAIRAASQG